MQELVIVMRFQRCLFRHQAEIFLAVHENCVPNCCMLRCSRRLASSCLSDRCCRVLLVGRCLSEGAWSEVAWSEGA